MDRRRHPRFDTDQPVSLTVLGAHATTLDGVVLNISGSGMRLMLDCRIPLNTAVRIDLGDSIFLGEVCYTEPAGDRFATGLVLDQVLQPSVGLEPLIQALRPEPVTTTIP